MYERLLHGMESHDATVGAAGVGGGGDDYVHIQTASVADWPITHSLGRNPSVVVVDSGGSTVIGDVEYLDEDHLVLHFTVAFSGTAYLN